MDPRRKAAGNMLAKTTYSLIGLSGSEYVYKAEAEILKDICEDLLQLAIQMSKE
jgi:hypothetical protein